MSFLSLNYKLENRIFGLDIMRCLAILMVVLMHSSSILEKGGSDFPWFPLLDGVEIFFVLSGYLIGTILIKKYLEEQLKGKDLWLFLKRRWLRTWPNYFLFLLINFLLVYLGLVSGSIFDFKLSFFFFLQNVFNPLHVFIDSWSLTIEEWFYLLFPLILILFDFLFSKKISRPNLFLIAIFIFLFTPVLLRVFIASSWELDKYWLQERVSKILVFRMDSIAYGLLGAYLNNRFPQLWFRHKNKLFVCGLVILYGRFFFKVSSNDYFAKTFYLTMCSIGTLFLLPLFSSIKKGPRIVSKIITHISMVSYSMYLLNLILVLLLLKYTDVTTLIWGWALFFLYWIILTFLSTILFKYFEKPFLNMAKEGNFTRLPKI